MVDPPPSPTAPAPLLWCGFLCLAALGAGLGYSEFSSPDLGWHLAMARWTVEQGRVPATDPLTWTLAGQAIVNSQWLFGLLVYFAHEVVGPLLITFLTIGGTLGFGALLVLRTWRREGRVPSSCLPLLLLFALGNFWEPRPHVLSWLLGSLVLWILEEHGRGARRGLPLLPVILCVWVNVHSLFVLGPVILGSFVLAHLVRCRATDARADRRLLAWSCAAVLACLVNPYHVHALLFPFEQLGDIAGAGVYKSKESGTAEFLSPFALEQFVDSGRLVLFQPALFALVFTALVVVAALVHRRRLRLVEWLLLAGFLYVFTRAGKNFGYLVMVAFPAAAAGLDELGQRIRTVPRRAGAGAVVLLCLLLVPLAWTGRLHALAWIPYARGTGFHADQLAVGACRFLRENRIAGRLLNGWQDGGYIAWATGQPVFLYSNGNIVGPRFYAEYVAAKLPGGFAPALRRWQPTVAVVRFSLAQDRLYHLAHDRAWRMVYADDHTAVFLHQSVAPHVKAIAKARPAVDHPQYDEATARAIVEEVAQREPIGPWQWLRGSTAWPLRATSRAGFFLQTGQLDACIGVALEGLQQTPFLVPDLLLTLGHALNFRKRHALADRCFDAVLRVEQDEQVVQQIHALRRAR